MSKTHSSFSDQKLFDRVRFGCVTVRTFIRLVSAFADRSFDFFNTNSEDRCAHQGLKNRNRLYFEFLQTQVKSKRFIEKSIFLPCKPPQIKSLRRFLSFLSDFSHRLKT